MKEDFTDFIELSGLLNYDPDTISKIYQKNQKDFLKGFGKLSSQFLHIYFLLVGIN